MMMMIISHFTRFLNMTKIMTVTTRPYNIGNDNYGMLKYIYTIEISMITKNCQGLLCINKIISCPNYTSDI